MSGQTTIDNLTQQIHELTVTNHGLVIKIDSLTNQISVLVTESADKDKQIQHLTEQIAYLTRKLYGKSSEKGINNQVDLPEKEEDLPDEDDEGPRY